MGGAIAGKDLFLETDGLKIGGRVGGEVIGFSADLLVAQGQLRGRLGGVVFGHDVNIETDEGDPLLAALIAVLTSYYYQETENRVA